MNVGDWYIENNTWQVFEVVSIEDSQVAIAPIENAAYEKGAPMYVTGHDLETKYKLCPTTETVEDILDEYSHYDYDRKFYRIGFVGLACRIKRVFDTAL